MGHTSGCQVCLQEFFCHDPDAISVEELTVDKVQLASSDGYLSNRTLLFHSCSISFYRVTGASRLQAEHP